MKTSRLLLLLFVLLGLGSPPAQGAGLILVDEAYWLPPDRRPPVSPPPRHPPFAPPRPRPHLFSPLTLQTCKAQISLTDQVAHVTLEQEFHNPNNRRMEGHFLFPLPRDAQISKFALEINGRPVEAELLEAEKARQIYEDIVRKLKDPALLEFADQRAFKVRLFPIEPHEKRTIRLSYDQLVPAERGLCEFRLPLGVGRFGDSPIGELSVSATVKTRQPLKSIYCPTHTTTTQRHGSHQASVVYQASNDTPEGDLQLFYEAEENPVGLSLLTHRDPDSTGTFLLLLSPGISTDDNRVVPKDVVFVADTSGSMAGGKLDQARKALLFCIENLNPDDRFEVVRFSTEAEPLFNRLETAVPTQIEAARKFIERFKPTGGTALDDALQQALSKRPPGSERPFVVIFLTDGRPTVGATDEDQIVAHVQKANEAATRVFCFGIGHDVNTHLLDKITELTRSSSQYVLPEEDLEIKVSNFFARIKDPVLVDPSLEWGPGVRITQLHPARLPDLFRGEQITLAGRYEGDGDTFLRLVGSVNGHRQTLTHEVHFPRQGTEHDFVPRLWATRRVGYLLDEMRLHGDNPELRGEVIELARRYGVVTPYTALLIVEDEGRRGVATRVQSLPALQQNRQAVRLAEAQTRSLLVQRYGAAPVARARSESALKLAETPSEALRGSQREAQLSYAASAADPGAASGPIVGRPPTSETATATDALQATAEQSRYVAGRTFFWNNDRWLDATIQQQSAGTPRQQITVGSSAYFNLARQHPAARPWLALGSQVEFVWNGEIIEIRD